MAAWSIKSLSSTQILKIFLEHFKSRVFERLDGYIDVDDPDNLIYEEETLGKMLENEIGKIVPQWALFDNVTGKGLNITWIDYFIENFEFHCRFNHERLKGWSSDAKQFIHVNYEPPIL